MNRKNYIPYQKNEKIRVVIMLQVASYWPSIESFYQACMDDDEVEIKIFYVNDYSVEKAQKKGVEEFLVENSLIYEIYSEDRLDAFKPHVALYQPPYDVLYRNPSALSIHLMNKGVRIMYIPYGIEIADTEDARLAHFNTYVVRNSWRIYTFSNIMLEDYQQYCPNRHAVRATGSPKFDAINRKEIALDENIRVQAAGRKIIVWKIHFPKLIYEGLTQRQVTPYLSEYLKFAENMDDFEDLFFVVMPHPLFFSSTMPEGLAKEAQSLFALLENKANVILDFSPDYRNSLYNADAIIVDRSALMVESGLCKVPVLYMSNREYEEPLTRAVKYLVDTYEQGKTADDMLVFVENVRKNAITDFMKKRNKVIEETMPFLDGACGMRIKEDLKDGVKKQTQGRIKIVFFGAGAVLAHYIEELHIFHNQNYEVLGLSDNSAAKWGTMHAGMQVIPPEKLKEIDFDILVITSEQYHMPIKQKLVYELFLDEEKIMRLDVFSEKYFSNDGVKWE